MIKKIFQRINEWLEDGLRSLLGRMTPDRRVILVLTMLFVFGGLSIYMTVSSIYNIGKKSGVPNGNRTYRNPAARTGTSPQGQY
jgi:hypothetical protein